MTRTLAQSLAAYYVHSLEGIDADVLPDFRNALQEELDCVNTSIQVVETVADDDATRAHLGRLRVTARRIRNAIVGVDDHIRLLNATNHP